MNPATKLDLEDERTHILRLDEEWAAAAARQEVERVLSFWSDDASVFPPGLPVVTGKAAIRTFVSESFRVPGFSIAWRTTQLTVAAAGDFAYGTGPNRVTYQGPDGNLVTVHGNAVTVWRKEPGGWKCVIDIWNESPSAAL